VTKREREKAKTWRAKKKDRPREQREAEQKKRLNSAHNKESAPSPYWWTSEDELKLKRTRRHRAAWDTNRPQNHPTGMRSPVMICFVLGCFLWVSHTSGSFLWGLCSVTESPGRWRDISNWQSQ